MRKKRDMEFWNVKKKIKRRWYPLLFKEAQGDSAARSAAPRGVTHGNGSLTAQGDSAARSAAPRGVTHVSWIRK